MVDTKNGAGLSTWSAQECPFTIGYSPRALDDIRLAVVDAFFSLPRGGAEIGGILCGNWDGERLTITDYAALDCEHAFGPSFALSPRDEAQLAALLAASAGNGLRPVGWYHSHTRSEIFLSDADQGIHRRFFPEPWQVALVLKPHTFHPARAGFFFRDDSGGIHAEASYGEFVLEPLAVKPAPSGAPAKVELEPAPDPVPEPMLLSRSDPEPASPALPAQPKWDMPPGLSLPANPDVLPPKDHARDLGETGREACPTGPAEPEEPVAPAPLPTFLKVPARPPRRWPMVVAAALLACCALGAAAYWKRDLWLPRVSAVVQRRPPAPAPPPPLGLNTIDSAGQLQIRWDRNSPLVQRATGGALSIGAGGPARQEIPLDKAHLLSGVFTFARQTERVDVSLSLTQPDGRSSREVTMFVGKLPDTKPVEDPAAQEQRANLTKQVAKMQTDLDAEIARNAKLQKSMDQMSKQLRNQQRSRLLNQIPK
jgi:proteasome lid subunit RPN8/RPN11